MLHNSSGRVNTKIEHFCLIILVICPSSLVYDCVNDEGITVADADNLIKVTKCGEDVITEWVKDHAE